MNTIATWYYKKVTLEESYSGPQNNRVWTTILYGKPLSFQAPSLPTCSPPSLPFLVNDVEFGRGTGSDKTRTREEAAREAVDVMNEQGYY